MKECRNRLYSINQNGNETEKDFGKDEMSMRSRDRLDCLWHEVKKKKNNIYSL
jgi:hypothetical protein